MRLLNIKYDTKNVDSRFLPPSNWYQLWKQLYVIHDNIWTDLKILKTSIANWENSSYHHRTRSSFTLKKEELQDHVKTRNTTSLNSACVLSAFTEIYLLLQTASTRAANHTSQLTWITHITTPSYSNWTSHLVWH